MTSQKSAGRRNIGTSESESHGHETALHELFLDELADIYNAEQQLVKALPQMAKAAQSDQLREALEAHLDETEEQISRLEEAAKTIGESIKRKTCKAMQGLIEEGKEILKDNKNSPALDAAIIAAAQKVEHYEIATYGTLCAWAEQMDHHQLLDLLKESLDEEAAADEKLTSVAEHIANRKAHSE